MARCTSAERRAADVSGEGVDDPGVDILRLGGRHADTVLGITEPARHRRSRQPRLVQGEALARFISVSPSSR